MEEAENLYDQLAPLCPILLALTASSSIFRGYEKLEHLFYGLAFMVSRCLFFSYLADVDCRWDIISASVDDRTKKEREPGGIPKSR